MLKTSTARVIHAGPSCGKSHLRERLASGLPAVRVVDTDDLTDLSLKRNTPAWSVEVVQGAVRVRDAIFNTQRHDPRTEPLVLANLLDPEFWAILQMTPVFSFFALYAEGRLNKDVRKDAYLSWFADWRKKIGVRWPAATCVALAPGDFLSNYADIILTPSQRASTLDATAGAGR